MDLALFLRYRETADISIRNRLVMDNLGIVHKAIRKIGLGPDYEDLVQAGTIGLIVGIDRYSPEKGAFYSFVKWRVLHEIQECLRKKHGTTYRQGSKDAAKRTPDEVAYVLGGAYLDPATYGGAPSVDARADLSSLLGGMRSDDARALLEWIDSADDPPKRGKAPPLPERGAALLAMARGRVTR